MEPYNFNLSVTDSMAYASDDSMEKNLTNGSKKFGKNTGDESKKDPMEVVHKICRGNKKENCSTPLSS